MLLQMHVACLAPKRSAISIFFGTASKLVQPARLKLLGAGTALIVDWDDLPLRPLVAWPNCNGYAPGFSDAMGRRSTMDNRISKSRSMRSKWQGKWAASSRSRATERSPDFAAPLAARHSAHPDPHSRDEATVGAATGTGSPVRVGSVFWLLAAEHPRASLPGER